MLSSFVLWVAFAAGVLSFLSPCLLPMLTIYFTLITGMSMSELQNIDNEAGFRKHVLTNTLMFVIAFGIVFAIAGGVAGQLGQLLQRNLKYLTIIGGVFILILSMRLLGVLKLGSLDRLNLHGLVDDARGRLASKGTPIRRYANSFLVGLIFAVACSHCIAPTLYSMLIYAGSTGSASAGMWLMAVFSLGLAIPYLLVGYSVGRAVRLIRRAARYERVISIAMGLMMLVFGLLMVTNRFTLLTQFFFRLVPYKLPLGM